MANLQRNTLQGVVEITKRPTMFLRDTFFRNTVLFDTEKVELDVDIEVRAMAEYTGRGQMSKAVFKDAFKTNTFIPPFISLSQALNEKDFMNRRPGQTEYQTSAMSAKDWATARAISKMDRMISLREEYQAMECLFNGQVTVGSNTISFDRDASLSVTLTGVNLWDQSTADPYENFLEWRDLIAEKSGQTPTDIILGSDAWKNLRSHAGFIALLDKLNIRIGSIEPVQAAPGVFRVMQLPEIGNFWTYPEKYVDPSTGTTNSLIPANKIAYVARDAEQTRYYGGVPVATDMGIDVVASDRVMDIDIQKDPAQELIIMKSAPLMAITTANAVLSAVVAP